MGTIDNKDKVKTQYTGSDNLDIRILLHDKYSVNRQGFGNWLFLNYQIKPGQKILELGCGNGRLWVGKLDALPKDISLTLSDFSQTMLNAAKENLKDKNITYKVIDIQQIPYPDESFDIVIANMMLYHVPDLDKALSEVKRVLKADGKFYTATLGERGITAFIRNALALPEGEGMKFTLQNGNDILKRYFNNVEVKLYNDSLEVTDTGDLIKYINTLMWGDELKSIAENEMMNLLDRHKKDGIIKIPKEYGTFIVTSN